MKIPQIFTDPYICDNELKYLLFFYEIWYNFNSLFVYFLKFLFIMDFKCYFFEYLTSKIIVSKPPLNYVVH